ncbi:MAG: hypothetical protein WA790_00185 [Sulfitobacter sp.]
MSIKSPANKVEQIGRISSIAELDGYEAQAKTRGLHADEVGAIGEKRAALSRGRV